MRPSDRRLRRSDIRANRSIIDRVDSVVICFVDVGFIIFGFFDALLAQVICNIVGIKENIINAVNVDQSAVQFVDLRIIHTSNVMCRQFLAAVKFTLKSINRFANFFDRFAIVEGFADNGVDPNHNSEFHI